MCQLSKECWKSQWNASLVVKTMTENSLFDNLMVEDVDYDVIANA
jgi:hypothetical protein